MRRRKLNMLACLAAGLFVGSCQTENNQSTFSIDNQIEYCEKQASRTLELIPNDTLLPRNIDKGNTNWRYVGYADWTSGFWPGILWYLYEYSEDEKWKDEAKKFSQVLFPLSRRSATDHDLGFQMFCSLGNGYRLTNDLQYKEVILRASDTLATLYNPKVGTILSWPGMVDEMDWPHNTIIDNMINLEMLFWSAKESGDSGLYKLAENHAIKTMNNHFREDYSVYHVIVYDTITGEKIKGVTHQGYNDESLWARGQAWAIYGYTMTYRETGNTVFLDFAQKLADVFLAHLPEDYIPYWDFDAPNIPNEPKDASAAAVTASALIELSTYVPGEKGENYLRIAEKMLEVLSSVDYQSRDINPAFLMHSTGHKPHNSEIDASINYADYYYLEALLRLRKLNNGTLNLMD